MLKKASYIIVAITFLVLVIHLFFGWMITNVDTFFFDAFAKFIRTGNYVFPIADLPYRQINTGAPPLYSLLLAGLYFFRRADVYLHVLQIMMLIGTSLLVYQMLKDFVGKKWALIVSCLFTLLPGNLIYVSLIMSDLGAQFLFTFYCYLIYRYLKTKKINYIAHSVLIGFVTGLWRYSFVIFGALSLLFFIIKRPKGMVNYISPVLGLAIIIAWFLIQHSLTGVWGLTVCTGIRYNIQMMWRAKVLPRKDHPSMIEIRKYIPEEVDLRQVYWDLEKYFVPHIGYDLVKICQLVGDVGKAAIYEHPIAFIKVTLDSFFRSHNLPPYQESLATYGLGYYIDYPPLYCGSIGTIETCKPIVTTKHSYPVWNAYIRASNFFYKIIFYFFSYFIFFPAVLVSLFFIKNIYTKIFSLLFIVGRLPIAMATFPDSRYVLPFYPLMVMIVVLVVRDLINSWKSEKKRRGT